MGYRLRSIYFLIPLIVLLFVPTVLPAYESGLAENAPFSHTAAQS